jgi:acetylglutamate kinase
MNTSASPSILPALTDASAITIVKIGGHVIDHKNALSNVLTHFSVLPGHKILVHGGGKLATEFAARLEVPQTMIDGRRVTDEETLKIATMVFAGLVNKNMVAALEARGLSALGVTGADADLIRAKKREVSKVDYGYVGDVESVRADRLLAWLNQGLTPVVAPITHNGKGQLLNTNADTIANAIAKTLSKDSRKFKVTLIYCFEKSGVLLDVENEDSVIREMNLKKFQSLKAEHKIFAGMIPKLENAFQAIGVGVNQVIIGKAEDLPQLMSGSAGTRITHG